MTDPKPIYVPPEFFDAACTTDAWPLPTPKEFNPEPPSKTFGEWFREMAACVRGKKL
jgi:hypothetical protein